MKINTLSASLLAATFALGLSVTAFANEDDWAQDQAPSFHGETDTGADVSFEELDADGDGHVNQADIPADHELANLFAQYDADGDGRLSRAEFDLYAGQTDNESDVESEPAE